MRLKPDRLTTLIFTALSLICLRVHGYLNAQEVPHLVGDEDTPSVNLFQKSIDEWDPRKLDNPYVTYVYGPDKKTIVNRILKRSDLGEFISDVAAAEALGKALFYEMQAGSDFRRVNGKFIGTACASCHYRFGTDVRNKYTTSIPLAAWDQYRNVFQDAKLPFGEIARAFDAKALAQKPGIQKRADLYITQIGHGEQRPKLAEGDLEANDEEEGPRTPLYLIVGSQGVERRIFGGINLDNKPSADGADWFSEGLGGAQPKDRVMQGQKVNDRWQMFSAGGKSLRQITSRNTPSVVNSGFADRLFHDGRAESTFNGYSIYGDFDHEAESEVIHVRTPEGTLKPVKIAITKAALAAQAVGPIMNPVEMSYEGRTFHDLAKKLLDAEALAYQKVDPSDSHLGHFRPKQKGNNLGLGRSYRELIRLAFRPEWWNGSAVENPKSINDQKVPLKLYGKQDKSCSLYKTGSLMEANFSLYWGLSIMLYEASLVSNQSPFDEMMMGRKDQVDQLWTKKIKEKEVGTVFMDRIQTNHPAPNGMLPPPFDHGSEVFQLGFRAFRRKGCTDCHEGPLLSELYSQDDASSPKTPIAYTMERFLFPNSKADAIAAEISQAKNKLLDNLVALLKASGQGQSDVSRKELALNLDGLRGEAAGSKKDLKKLTKRLLASDDDQLNDKIASLLIQFEKSLASQVGNRQYFTEDERIAWIDRNKDQVLLERTFVLPTPQPYRRPLPIKGLKALTPYAFYDLGFYNLGVSPPQYDRGNGDFVDIHTDSSSVHHVFDSQKGYQKYTPVAKSGMNPKRKENQSLKSDSFLNRDEPNLEAARRSDIHYFSRARNLVMDESPWGYRKPFVHDNELAFWGSFKTPTLRNVELTAPYMHNGRLMELFDVVDFYDRGGDIPRDMNLNPDKHPAIDKISLTDDEKIAIVFFLMCLTDKRVEKDAAPFDHPSLSIVNGYIADGDDLKDNIIDLPEVGASGISDEINVGRRFPATYPNSIQTPSVK